MCMILLAYQAHPDYPLIVAANREESFSRSSRPADFWPDYPEIYGGRDLEKDGTWMGITKSGRFAAVTNFREGQPKWDAPRSRGVLVRDFLAGRERADRYLKSALSKGSQFEGFSMLAGDLGELWYATNRRTGVLPVTPGVHGLSNHVLNEPWTKVTTGKAVLNSLLDADEGTLLSSLSDMLGDRTWAEDDSLPDTGLTRQRERELSPAFIMGESYGTRASTLLLVREDGHVTFRESRFGPMGKLIGVTTARFAMIDSPRDRNRREATAA
jgi:uncharacterized protein with NRDE domain